MNSRSLVVVAFVAAVLLLVGSSACSRLSPRLESVVTPTPQFNPAMATPKAQVSLSNTKTPTVQQTNTPAPPASPTSRPAVKASPTTNRQSTSTPTTSKQEPTAATKAHPQPAWSLLEEDQNGKKRVLLRDGANAYTVSPEAPESFEQYLLAFVLDVNGDGILEAVVEHFTGGAHCCAEFSVFSSEPGGIRLHDSFDLGNAGIADKGFMDLDGDEIPEIKTADDRLAYFPDLSYAGTPFLPLVLCRSDQGKYIDCTSQFPQFLIGSAGEYERRMQDLAKRPQSGTALLEERSVALGLLASYLRLNQADEGWSRVRALAPETEDWLRQNLAELDKRLKEPVPRRG